MSGTASNDSSTPTFTPTYRRFLTSILWTQSIPDPTDLLGSEELQCLRCDMFRNWLHEEIRQRNIPGVSLEKVIADQALHDRLLVTILIHFVQAYGTTGSLLQDLLEATTHFAGLCSMRPSDSRRAMGCYRFQHLYLWGTPGRAWWFWKPAKEVLDGLRRFTVSPAELAQFKEEQYWQETLREVAQNGGQAVISCRHKTKTPNLNELRGVKPPQHESRWYLPVLHRICEESSMVPIVVSSLRYLEQLRESSGWIQEQRRNGRIPGYVSGDPLYLLQDLLGSFVRLFGTTGYLDRDLQLVKDHFICYGGSETARALNDQGRPLDSIQPRAAAYRSHPAQSTQERWWFVMPRMELQQTLTSPWELTTGKILEREQTEAREFFKEIGRALDRIYHNTQYVRAWDLAQKQAVDISEQNLQALQEFCHQEAKDRGWHEKPREIGTMIALIHSELSEALEGARKGAKDDKLPERDALEVELADAVIRILDLAGREGLDLMGAVQEKLQYNRTRADHQPEHREAPGGKKW